MKLGRGTVCSERCGFKAVLVLSCQEKNDRNGSPKLGPAASIELHALQAWSCMPVAPGDGRACNKRWEKASKMGR